MDGVAEQVNDIHSRLNATPVSRVARPRDSDSDRWIKRHEFR